MAAFWALTVVLLAGTACSAYNIPNRIVGGQSTTIDKYPSIVQVDFYDFWTGTWSQSCAATVLTARYLLSAAHCFAGLTYRAEYRRIRAGSTFRNTGGILSYVDREINHPSYGQFGYDGDISVVRLLTALVYSPVVQQGKIISQDALIPDNVPVVHAGWGRTSQGGIPSPDLRDVTISTVNNQHCNEIYDGSVTPNMICAGILGVGGKDACQGDSGGPLYYGSDDIVIGVVSWGQGCALAQYPGVSTNVASYTNWIVANAV